MIYYDPTLPIAKIEIPSKNTFDITSESNVYTITKNLYVQHLKFIDDTLLEEVQKVMIENDIPEMYVFNDTWIINAMKEKMAREREVYYGSTQT